MANTAKQLAQGDLGTGDTALYTVPASTTTVLKSIDLTNTSPHIVNASLFIVPSGGSIAGNNALLYQYALSPNDSLGWEGEQVMGAGAMLRGKGNYSGVSVTASGVEIY